jgi:adenylosuccinate synthase
MTFDIVIGTQWGDEGKGRVVDLLSSKADFVARFNGGDNAGHTVTVGDQTYQLHLIPSGIIHPHTIGIIGNGLVINPKKLLAEIAMLQKAGIAIDPSRLKISFAAHIITPGHLALDAAREKARGKEKIGTTLRGIGPAYNDKANRSGLRLEQITNIERLTNAIVVHIENVNHQLRQIYNADPLNPREIAAEYREYAEQLAPYICDVSGILDQALSNNQIVLGEGAQGTLLDIDHGTYPFVTSSNPTAPGALLGLGVGAGYLGRIVGVTKAFQTRVGAGPFPTEVFDQIADQLRGTGENPWDEYGTTTGRPRRVGWLDLVLLRYAKRINGLTELTVTKLDILSGIHPLLLCHAYRQDKHTTPELTFGPSNLAPFQPIFETMSGWDADIGHARKWTDLPSEAQNYIQRIEDLVNVPVKMVSVGPERDQIVVIN